MYHRIAVLDKDPWQLAVTPGHFEQQLQILSKKNVISISQLVLQLKRGRLKQNSVVVTFDDAYIDNYTTARPLLEKYKVPATFFIATKNIGTNNEYWWDELGSIIKDDNAYLEEWQKLLPLPFQKQQERLAELRSTFRAIRQTNPENTCMSIEQLQELSNSELFSLHAHTITHPALAHQPPEVQEREMKDGWNHLSNITGESTGTIAYPYGNYNDDTISMPKKYFEAAFTTEPSVISKRSDLYRLGRFKVNDWDGNTFEAQLNKWFKG